MYVGESIMSAKLSELKLPKVRRLIQYEFEGEKRIITVFNPIGKKRLQLLEILSSIDKVGEENINDVADTLYRTLLKELVDIEVDMKKLTTLDKYPSLALMEINKEIDEIIFELQYEYITGQIRKANQTIISAMSGVLINKTEKINELLEDLK
jgi:hypothetical protein